MAPQIKKAKTAFLFYQADQLAKIRKEKGLAMGEAMTEVSLYTQYILGSLVALFVRSVRLFCLLVRYFGSFVSFLVSFRFVSFGFYLLAIAR